MATPTCHQRFRQECCIERPIEGINSGMRNMVRNTKEEAASLAKELYVECVPASSAVTGIKVGDFFRSWIHIPYLPAFHRPGWLLYYLTGPFDALWLESILSDFWAGITVAMLLIPQGLSYASLANLPPVNGLYSALLPSALYTFFGSSLQLAVGPVAIVSLLMGALVSQYGIVPGSQDSVDLAAEAALAMGVILLILSFFNCGNFIRYLSYPVMTGFTAAAASLIGMNQIKNMFGFTTSYFPQTGDAFTESNWQVMEFIIDNYNSFSTSAPSARPTIAPTPIPTAFKPTRAPTTFAPSSWGPTPTYGGHASLLAPTVQPSISIKPTVVPTPMPSPKPSKSAYSSAVKTAEVQMASGHQVVNPYAIAICFGLWSVLAFINTMKKRFKATAARKKSWCFAAWSVLANIAPFFAIIIGAGIAAKIKINDHNNNWDWTCNGQRNPTPYVKCGYLDKAHPGTVTLQTNRWQHEWYAYTLKVVGVVAPGLNIARIPNFKWPFGDMLIDVLPLTLIAFMESYSVARKMATLRNELHILNSSQEMFAVGLGNIFGCVTGAYPVAGSFSRSSLNLASGARTPLSKVTVICVILLALGTLTETFGYIPQAALAAVIMASISSLVDLRDFWNAWKYSKKDFFTMIFTSTFTFVYDTKWGIVAGIACSLLLFVGEIAFAQATAPKLMHASKDNKGIDVVTVEGDVMFLTSNKVKDFLIGLVLSAPVPIDPATANQTEVCKDRCIKGLDSILSPQLLEGVLELPKALVVDLAHTRIIDLTGLQALKEVQVECTTKGILFVVINTIPEVTSMMIRFGISSSKSSDDVNVDAYLKFSNLPIKEAHSKSKTALVDASGSLNVEFQKSRDEGDIEMETGKAGGAISEHAYSNSASELSHNFASVAQTDSEVEWAMKNGGRVRRNSIPPARSMDSEDGKYSVSVTTTTTTENVIAPGDRV